MYSTIFLTCIFVVFISRTYCDDTADDRMAIIDQVFGAGNTCFFTYEGFTLEDVIELRIPSAKLLGVGRLPEHRLDFINPYYVTPVPEKGEEVWGLVCIVPIQEYKDFAAKSNYVDGVKLGRFVVRKIEVKVNDKTKNIDCNLGMAINLPEKITPLPENRRPTKETIKSILDVCVKYNFPKPYCDKVQSIATSD